MCVYLYLLDQTRQLNVKPYLQAKAGRVSVFAISGEQIEVEVPQQVIAFHIYHSVLKQKTVKVHIPP